MTDIELLPMHLLEHFESALKGQRGELDAWLEVNNETDVRLHVEAYVAHATAAKDAEIEELRAINDNREAIIATHAADTREYQRQIMHAEARAERLAEALRELRDLMLGQVKWAPCDCRCPQQRKPDGPHSVTWLRAAQQVEIAISKAEGKE